MSRSRRLADVGGLDTATVRVCSGQRALSEVVELAVSVVLGVQEK